MWYKPSTGSLLIRKLLFYTTEEMQQRAVQGGALSHTTTTPLTGLHLTLLKGGGVQARCAHLPGAKRVRVDSWHPQTRANTRADACAQGT